MIEKLKQLKNEARKNGDAVLLRNTTLVIGELDRQIEKDLDNEQIMKIIKKLRKSEAESLGFQDKETSSLLQFLDSYLPKQVTPEEISAWMEENVDFDSLRNKMQAVGIIMKHFGQDADGKMVKDAILNR
jgi:uncharacterized protein YqeY